METWKPSKWEFFFFCSVLFFLISSLELRLSIVKSHGGSSSSSSSSSSSRKQEREKDREGSRATKAPLPVMFLNWQNYLAEIFFFFIYFSSFSSSVKLLLMCHWRGRTRRRIISENHSTLSVTHDKVPLSYCKQLNSQYMQGDFFCCWRYESHRPFITNISMRLAYSLFFTALWL